jgi:hypothetical protein
MELYYLQRCARSGVSRMRESGLDERLRAVVRARRKERNMKSPLMKSPLILYAVKYRAMTSYP